MPPEILVVVRASPIRARTVELLRTVEAQGLAGVVKTMVVYPGRDGVLTTSDLRLPDAEERPSQPSWERQALDLVKDSGCRWVVFPSSVDRYLPNGFQTVLESPISSGQSAIGRCRFTWRGALVEPGFRDLPASYFAWLTGFNHSSPGAAFLDARTFVDSGGFDPRYPHAGHLEYLLRIGPRSRILMFEVPIVETQASPFPGVPTESAAAYALEAASVTMQYYRAVLTPGAMLGLAAVMSERLRGLVGWGLYYEEDLARALTTARMDWADRYVQALDPTMPHDEPKTAEPSIELTQTATVSGPPLASPQLLSVPPTLALRVRLQAKRVLPRPIWNLLRQSRRVWLTLREPLP
jgi:hypothetical protein